MPDADKNPHRKKVGGESKRGKKSTDIQAVCNTYFKKGEFNCSVIASEAKFDRETVAKYRDIYLTEVRTTTGFIEREQNSRDALALYLEGYVVENNKEIEKLNKLLPKAGKSLGMIISIIANLRKENKETTKEIAGLNMMPLTEDKIEQAILAKYGIKIEELQKKQQEAQTPPQQ